MIDFLEFMKNLFFCILYLTGIITCFFFMISFLENILEKNKKENKKVITINGDKYLDEETRKELDKVAEKLAKKYVEEMTSDEYEKED